MSVNCVSCVIRNRTGHDLLCDQCRKPSEVSGIVAMLDILRASKGDSVNINCRNHETRHDEAETIDCCGRWTGWVMRRFANESLYLALVAAVTARRKAERANRRDDELSITQF